MAGGNGRGPLPAKSLSLRLVSPCACACVLLLYSIQYAGQVMCVHIFLHPTTIPAFALVPPHSYAARDPALTELRVQFPDL